MIKIIKHNLNSPIIKINYKIDNFKTLKNSFNLLNEWFGNVGLAFGKPLKNIKLSCSKGYKGKEIIIHIVAELHQI